MLLRKFLPLACIPLLGSVALADEPARDQLQPNAPQSLLLDITRAGDALVAVGERGHVLIGKDAIWQQVATPSASQLTKVFFLDDKLGWAVGHDATILHTDDGGLSWVKQFEAPSRERPFMDVLFTSASDGMAIGAYGLFFTTNDGGKNWQEAFHDELLGEEDAAYLNELKETDPEGYALEKASLLPHFNRIIRLDDGRLLMVGELGLVAVSSDGGARFSRVNFDYDGSMFNAIEAHGKVFVMGLRGHAFAAGLGLDDWQQLSLPVESSINGALVSSKGGLYLVGNAGVVLAVNDNAEAELVARRQGENLLAGAEDKQGRIWLVGAKGVFALDSAQTK
ncbi:hypothetical protein KJI95_14205 [Shewanella sp. JM162201]|uniref:Photosynthesis system II assembly factor Ycf48/Hcf136-like domain-containing protein n=1 Tax=Shewanella jiangmenensis TaxID=2837387 RepID=A0ABS5V9F4_9GAMM|nr:hypothetical protein [Shewanella jiangmenensis]MBT1445663.1 hypothetical protein [Shewanella jiangmenensis]